MECQLSHTHKFFPMQAQHPLCVLPYSESPFSPLRPYVRFKKKGKRRNHILREYDTMLPKKRNIFEPKKLPGRFADDIAVVGQAVGSAPDDVVNVSSSAPPPPEGSEKRVTFHTSSADYSGGTPPPLLAEDAAASALQLTPPPPAVMPLSGAASPVPKQPAVSNQPPLHSTATTKSMSTAGSGVDHFDMLIDLICRQSARSCHSSNLEPMVWLCLCCSPSSSKHNSTRVRVDPSEEEERRRQRAVFQRMVTAASTTSSSSYNKGWTFEFLWWSDVLPTGGGGDVFSVAVPTPAGEEAQRIVKFIGGIMTKQVLHDILTKFAAADKKDRLGASAGTARSISTSSTYAVNGKGKETEVRETPSHQPQRRVHLGCVWYDSADEHTRMLLDDRSERRGGRPPPSSSSSSSVSVIGTTTASPRKESSKRHRDESASGFQASKWLSSQSLILTASDACLTSFDVVVRLSSPSGGRTPS